MIVTVNSQKFAEALRSVVKVVPSQPAIQILAYVLLDATSILTLSATDLEVSLTTACASQIQAQGKCALPAATLLRLIEQFPDGNVTLMADDKGARVQFGMFSSRLQTMMAGEFPTLQPPEGQTVPLAGDQLARLIDSTRYAVAERGKKYVLEATLLKLSGESMGMVATDSARLSIATAKREPSVDLSVLIPRKTLDVLPILGNGKIEMLVGTNHIFFTTDKMELTSRMIDGKFPTYERIVPKNNDQTLRVDKAKLMSALKRVGVATEKNCAIYMSVAQNAVKVAAKSIEVGEADEQLPAIYEGTPMTLCFNWRYMLDFLEVARQPTTTIKMKDGKSSILLMDDESFINVIMTMKG